jgi:hypothetical protein
MSAIEPPEAGSLRAKLRSWLDFVWKAQCLGTPTNAPWYFRNRQIQEDLGIHFFADHNQSAESLDSKSVDAGNPSLRQLEGTRAY